MLEDLSREELLDLIDAYSNYVVTFYEDRDDGYPVSVYEYYENDYDI